MANKEMTLIHYHIPEDRDDPEVPNVFAIPLAKANIKLAHVYQYFPLKGTYTFRFKFVHDNFVVWLDLSDINSKIPLFKDKIILKANRLSWNQSKVNPVTHPSNLPHNHTSNQPNKNQNNMQNTQKQKQINLFDHEPAKAKEQNKKIAGEPNLLGELHELPTQSQKIPDLNLFQLQAGEVKKADFNYLAGFDKHGDLI